MQQKFRMFLYIIRPIGIRVKICDYVNQNTAHSRGIDLSERTVLEMSVITKAGLLALAAVLLLPSAQTTQAAQPEPLIVIVQKRQDAQERTLRVLRDGSVEEAALDTYLAQVVLSEMPASFAPEALKAQAVAARTFACRQTAGGKHENADVCAQSACCQACLTVEDLRARYGDGFEAAWDKALAAVRETQNEVLTYEGALIDAVYFSCSGGRIFISCFGIFGGTQSSAGFRTIRRSFTARSSALCSIVWMPRIVESLSPGCFPFCASRSRPCSRKSLYNPCKSRPVSFLSGISPIRGVICNSMPRR